MNFRQASNNDINQIKNYKIHAYSFPKEYADKQMKNIFVPEKCTVAEENNSVVSYAQTADYGVYSNGTEMTASCLNDVYTTTSYRHMGYMKQTVSETLKQLNMSKIPFCFCVPFDYKVFDSMGFRLVSDIKEYHLSSDDIPAYKISEKIIFIDNFNNINDTINSQMSDVYIKYMTKKSKKRFFTARSTAYRNIMLDDFIENYNGTAALLYDGSDNMTGYALYIIDDDTICVYDYAYINTSAYRSIFALIKNYKYQTDKIVIKTATDDMAFLDFTGNNTETKILPFAMARITNIQSALAPFAPALTGVTLKLFDPLISDNNGIFTIDANTIMPSSSTPDIETDIGTFTQIYLGYISLEDASDMGYANIYSNKDTVSRVFKKQNNYINMLL